MEKVNVKQHVKKQRALVTLLYTAILVSILLNLFTFQQGHDWGGDFSLYIIQAEAIVEHNIQEIEDFSILREQISEINLGPTFYPWGFPLILVPAIYFFGTNIMILKIWVYVFFILSLPLIYLIFKKKLNKIYLLFLILLLALNPYFLNYKNHVLSEFPFLFFSLLAILAIQAFVIEKKYLYNKSFSYFLLGIFLFLSYFIRSLGIIFLPLLFFSQIIEYKKALRGKSARKEKNYSFLIPYVIFFLLVILSSFLFPSPSYRDTIFTRIPSFKGWIMLVLKNIYYYSTILADFFGQTFLISNYLSLRLTPIFYVVYGISIPFFFLGLFKNYKRNYLYVLYFIFTLLLLLVLPFKDGFRYLFSVLPFFIFFLIKGLEDFDSNKLFKKFKLAHFFIFLLFILFLLQICFFILFYSNNSLVNEGPYSEQSQELFEFIKANTLENDIIIFFKPRVLTLYTRRPSAAIFSYNKLLDSKADYYIHYKKFPLEKEMAFKVKNNPNLTKIYKNKDFEVFKLKN